MSTKEEKNIPGRENIIFMSIVVRRVYLCAEPERSNLGDFDSIVSRQDTVQSLPLS